MIKYPFYKIIKKYENFIKLAWPLLAKMYSVAFIKFTEISQFFKTEAFSLRDFFAPVWRLNVFWFMTFPLMFLTFFINLTLASLKLAYFLSSSQTVSTIHWNPSSEGSELHTIYFLYLITRPSAPSSVVTSLCLFFCKI